MTGDTTVRHVHAAHAAQTVSDALFAAGVPRDLADIQAGHLVEAELRGHPSHGLRRLPTLVGRIHAGLLRPDARPVFNWGAESALLVDGNLGLGPVVAYEAIDRLIERTTRTGVAVAALRRTHHLGMLAPYVERLAENGCVGLALSSTEGLVHPWGGAGALLGTNPISAAVPAQDRGIVLDMSTGAVSAGKILDYAERGQPLPPGWAVDETGHPTSDAAKAARGAISPFGGAKGYALGLTLGSIVSLLTDTAFGPDVRGTLDETHEVTKGDVIIAIRLTAFRESATSPDLESYLDLIRTSGTDGRAVTVPGDRARHARDASSAHGFPVTEGVWASVVQLAAGGVIAGVDAGDRA